MRGFVPYRLAARNGSVLEGRHPTGHHAPSLTGGGTI